MKTLIKNLKIVFLLIFIIFFSCKNIESNSIKNNQKDEELFGEVLKEQLDSGESALYNNSFDIVLHEYTIKDLQAIIPYFSKQVYDMGYKKPTAEEFKDKIVQIFGQRNEDNFYINMEDAADVNLKFNRNDNSINNNPYSMYIIKDTRLVMPIYAIPEIFDYRAVPKYKKYEDLVKKDTVTEDGVSIEKKLWKSINVNYKEGIKTIYSRNSYLFNENNIVVPWLLKNDKKFMYLIANNFGYMKSPEHKKWFVEQGVSSFEDNAPNNCFTNRDVKLITNYINNIFEDSKIISISEKIDKNSIQDFMTDSKCHKTVTFTDISNCPDELVCEVYCYFNRTQEELDEDEYSEEIMYLYFKKINNQISLYKLEGSAR